MKKKAIKIATSTAIAATAFVAGAPVNQADAAVNVDQLVTDAQNAGTVLKWAISVEGSADYVTRPYDQYNAAKKAIANAEAALKGLSFSDKLKYEAKLTDPKIQVTRAGAYIDAITSSEKIKGLTDALNAAVKSGDLDDVEAAYHKATAEYRKQAKLLDRVYGQSTRDGIRDAVKPALEKLVADLKNDVTVNMLAREAAELVKADKVADAGKKIAEAQAILDANKLAWETELQKSVDDVVAGLPLTVTSVSRVNDTTVVVSLNKPVAAVYTSDFTIDNNLFVTSAVLGADKKTVTLTTTKQDTGKTYTVTYKGTSAQFSTAAAAPGPITVDGTEVYSDLSKSEVVVATFKDKNGKINQAPVTLAVPDTLNVVSVNGIATGGLTDTTGSYVPNAAGQLVIIVEGVGAANVLDAELTYTQGTETKKSAKLNFFTNATVPLTETTGKVVAVASDYFIVQTGTSTQEKIRLKSSDVVQYKGAVTTLDDFKAKLSIGDIVVGTYNPAPSSSVLNLHHDQLAGYAFEVNEDTTVRVDGTHVTFTGNGEAGKIVAVYGVGNALVNSTTIGSNGKWSIEVPVASANSGVFQLLNHTDLTKPVPTSSAAFDPGTTVDHTVVAGAFQATVTPATYTDTLNGMNLVMTVRGILTDEFKLQNGASITLVDGDGTRVTFVDDKENTDFAVSGSNNETLTITFGYTAPTGGSVPGLQGTLTIIDLKNIENDNGLKLKVSGLNVVNAITKP